MRTAIRFAELVGVTLLILACAPGLAADAAHPSAPAANAPGGVVKLVFLLKRHPGMSREDFIQYYESHHARLGEKYVPNALRYVRRFLEPLPGPYTGTEAQYDVLTELWFANKDEMDKAMKLLADPKVHAEIEADENYLFDRPSMRGYVITEHESKVHGRKAKAN